MAPVSGSGAAKRSVHPFEVDLFLFMHYIFLLIADQSSTSEREKERKVEQIIEYFSSSTAVTHSHKRRNSTTIKKCSVLYSDGKAI